MGSPPYVSSCATACDPLAEKRHSPTADKRTQERGELRLSVLIPVYNEEPTLDELLSAVLAVDIPKEVIVVDDCSTDGTAALLDRWADRVEVLCHPVNRGKGAAVRTAEVEQFELLAGSESALEVLRE